MFGPMDKFTKEQYQKMADLAEYEPAPLGILLTIAPDGNPYPLTQEMIEHGKTLIESNCICVSSDCDCK